MSCRSRAQPRAKLILAIARARRWLNQITSGAATIESIAQQESFSIKHVRTNLTLSFLDPTIISAPPSQDTCPKAMASRALPIFQPAGPSNARRSGYSCRFIFHASIIQAWNRGGAIGDPIVTIAPRGNC